MKTLTNITGQIVDRADWTGPREVRSAMHIEMSKGCFARVVLTPAGLVILRGNSAFGIPMSEILQAGAAVLTEPRPSGSAPESRS